MDEVIGDAVEQFERQHFVATDLLSAKLDVLVHIALLKVIPPCVGGHLARLRLLWCLQFFHGALQALGNLRQLALHQSLQFGGAIRVAAFRDCA